MITIENCKVELFGYSKKIAYIQLPNKPDFETMKLLGRGKPCNNTESLALQYNINGITFFLHR